MPTLPPHQNYEYREVESLEDVNKLALEEDYDLFQAVAVGDHLRFIVRRVREAEQGRRVGFAGAAEGSFPG